MRRGILRLFLLLLLGVTGWACGLVWYIQTLPRPPTTENTSWTDGVVVLTGGTGRLQIALDLLSAQKTGKLFITGVYRGVDVSELLRLSKQAPAELACCITLDYEADDTLENAVQSAAWVRRMEIKSIRLVTSDYHLRRSMMEFRMAMPHVTIIAHPVTPPHLNLAEWWQSKTLVRLMALEYSKFLIVGVRYSLYLLGIDQLSSLPPKTPASP